MATLASYWQLHSVLAVQRELEPKIRQQAQVLYSLAPPVFADFDSDM
jgi:hypothetical protein